MQMKYTGLFTHSHIIQFTYLLITYLLITSVSGFCEIFFETAYCFMQIRLNVSALHTWHGTLYNFSSRQKLIHWTRSVANKQPQHSKSTARYEASLSCEYLI